MYLKKLLWWCAGADSDILRRMSNAEQQRYSAIGSSIILTGILSLVSAIYIINEVTESLFSSIFLGAVWSILVINLNRLMHARVQISNSNRIKFTIIFPLQLFFSFIIVMTVTLPITLKLFEDQINSSIVIGNERKLNEVEKIYVQKIDSAKKEKMLLEMELFDQMVNDTSENQYLTEIKKLKLEQSELRILNLNRDLNSLRTPYLIIKIGLTTKISALFKMIEKDRHLFAVSLLITLLFFMIQILPTILSLFGKTGLYEKVLGEINKNDINNQPEKTELQKLDSQEFEFKQYCSQIILDLQLQIDQNQKKASELMRYGIVIIISGILFYIGMIYFFLGVFLESHSYKPHYTYFMISISLLFLFIQFLGGWFLKQYRQTLNTSLYLNNLKPSADKYLLSYYAICEFSEEDERKKLIRELLLVLNNDSTNLNQSIQDSKTENFASEVMNSINSLKDLINNLK